MHPKRFETTGPFLKQRLAALPPKPYRCPHRAERRCRTAILCRADGDAGARGMPTFWGWSRAAPAPQANVRRRLLRRLSDARNRAETRAGDTGDVARLVRPCPRREKAITAFDSLRSRRLRTFAWGAGAARDQPQNVGIPRAPASPSARHRTATAQGLQRDQGNGKPRSGGRAGDGGSRTRCDTRGVTGRRPSRASSRALGMTFVGLRVAHPFTRGVASREEDV